MKRPLHVLLLFAALLLLANAAAAQRYGGAWEVFRQTPGLQVGAELGGAMVGVPDLDGDLVPDLVVSAPYSDSVPFVDNGVVEAFSGATGAGLWAHTGLQNNESRGWAVARAGDWNADTVGDVVSGSPFYDPLPLVDAGLVKILDGVTGIQIFTFVGANSGDMFGYSADGGFDFDHDGFDDIIVGAPGADYGGLDSGRVYLYSGAIGALVWTFDGLAAGDLAGYSVAWIGDVDGDAIDDFLIGAPNAALGDGMCLVVSGITGAILRTHAGAIASVSHMGHEVTAGRDLNGNGVPDYAASAPAAFAAGGPFSGAVEVYEGSTGAAIYTVAGTMAGDRVGISLAMSDDLNTDGVADLLVGGGGAGYTGLLQIHDGKTGIRLFRLDGPFANARLAQSVACAGDLDGSGEPEVAFGMPGSAPAGLANAGEFHILAFQPCMTSSRATLSAAAGGTVNYTIDFPMSEAGLVYMLLGSSSGMGPTIHNEVAIPLAVDALLLDFVSGSPPAGFAGVYGTLDAFGDGTASLTATPGAASAYVGVTFWFSVVSRTAPLTPHEASVAVPLTVNP